MTYARRYSLSAMVGLTTTETDQDDDGHGATHGDTEDSSSNNNQRKSNFDSKPKGAITRQTKFTLKMRDGERYLNKTYEEMEKEGIDTAFAQMIISFNDSLRRRGKIPEGPLAGWIEFILAEIGLKNEALRELETTEETFLSTPTQKVVSGQVSQMKLSK
jgi:hypothetical protein